MKKYILIVLAIFVCSTIYGQKSAAARSAVRQAYKTSIKQNVRNGAKTASKNAVKNSLQDAMVNRSSKAVVRKRLTSEMRINGVTSLRTLSRVHLKEKLSKSLSFKDRRVSHQENQSWKHTRNKQLSNVKRYADRGFNAAKQKVNKIVSNNSFFEENKFLISKNPDGSIVCRYPNHSTSAIISIDGKKLYAKAGCTVSSRSRNEFLTNPEPNMTYIVDDIIEYKTDKYGRVIYARANETDLYKSAINRLDRPKDYLKQIVNEAGVSSSEYDAGHLFSFALGGPHEKINLVPMKNTWQRPGGEWGNLENRRQKAVKNGGKVLTEIFLDYSKHPTVPEIHVESIIDGVKFQL